MFELGVNPTPPSSASGDSKQKNATASLESAVDAQRGTQWLILCRPQGVIEVCPDFLIPLPLS